MNSKKCPCGLKRECPILDKPNSLEDTLKFHPKRTYDSIIQPNRIIPFEELIRYIKLNDFAVSTAPGIDPKSGARIVDVMPYELPSSPNSRVLGMYDPNSHTIYIANDLSKRDRDFVYHHEVAHALGERDEAAADRYAQAQVGYMISGRERYHRLAA